MRGGGQYRPSGFDAGSMSVQGELVLLLENSPATGARATNTAGALYEYGAEAVEPLAPTLDPDYWLRAGSGASLQSG
jgi:hypothetical protein